MIIVEGSHWIQGEGNQAVATSKVRQKAGKDLRTGEAGREVKDVWEGEQPVGIAACVESGNIPTSC